MQSQYSKDNPHPDLKYIATLGKTVWYQCQRCKEFRHSLNYFGWTCPNCQDEQEEQKQQIITDAFDY